MYVTARIIDGDEHSLPSDPYHSTLAHMAATLFLVLVTWSKGRKWTGERVVVRMEDKLSISQSVGRLGGRSIGRASHDDRASPRKPNNQPEPPLTPQRRRPAPSADLLVVLHRTYVQLLYSTLLSIITIK